MNSPIKTRVGYRMLCILALAVGLAGIAFQFLADWEFFSFFLSVAVTGGLIGGRSVYSEQERQHLQWSFQFAYEWLLLAVLAMYAVIELSRWLPLGIGVVDFLNAHWPGLMLSMMCALLGLAGLYRLNKRSL